MRAPRSFAPAAIALTLLGMSAPVHAGSVVLLNNLDQPPLLATSNPFVGQSFIAGTVNAPLQGARMQLDPTEPPTQSIMLEVESRNFDGTVGTTLFSNFSSSFDPTTGLVTFTAKSAFELTAGTGYWLVLSDPAAGGVTWEFTESYVYQSQYAYGLPSYNTAWISNQDNGQGNSTYYQPSDGPQLFQLITVPEPPAFLLLSFPVVLAVFAMCFQGAGASQFQRPRAPQAREAVRQ
jgi:hypothetical protein